MSTYFYIVSIIIYQEEIYIEIYYNYAKNVYRESTYRNIIGFCIVSIITYQEELYKATVNNFFRDRQIYWWRKPEYSEKTTDLLQVTDKLYYTSCTEYTSPWAGFEFITLVVIGTDCTGSCKSNSIQSRPRQLLPGRGIYDYNKSLTVKFVWTKNTEANFFLLSMSNVRNNQLFLVLCGEELIWETILTLHFFSKKKKKKMLEKTERAIWPIRETGNIGYAKKTCEIYHNTKIKCQLQYTQHHKNTTTKTSTA